LEVTDATCSTFAAADFKINGGTTYSNNVYTLTPDLGGQNGSVWNQNRVYLDQDFDFKTKVFLGSNDDGADGIAFVLQNQSLSAGSSGGGLGYAGISPSFAVEFDTYQNAGDPTQDHIALIANGNTGANHSTYTPVHEVQMENGQWHTARFVWDASAKNFQVWYDGVLIHNATIDLKADIFNGRPYVYWGMTAATGGAKNLQKVEFESYCYVQQVSTSALAGTNNTAASLSFCTGATVRLQASASASYQWYKDGVAISGATARELEASASGAYTVESVSSSTQISTTSEVATVTVNPLPAFTYSSTYSFERTKAITTVSPSSTGGAVASYAISAALPAGLSFNTTTGRISGTPTALSAAVTYTVTGTSASSCVSTTTFSLEVFNAVIPSALSYSPSTQTVRAGTAITVMTPTSSGGAVGTYTISPALPAGLTINATTGIISGTLTQAQTGSITYTVTASNTGGSTTAEITLVFNTAPTNLALSPASVDENKASGSSTGTLSSTDIDSGDTHTYALVSGTGSTDNALFTIDGANLKAAAAFDFETKSSYTVRVRTTDAGGLTFEKAITITVLDVNDAPTNLALSATTINENNAIGAIIGALSSTDVDAGDTFTYTLVSGTGSTDNASFTIDGANLKAAAAFDFETKSSYTVRVRTTDAGGLTFEKAITITVLNINDAPTNLALSATTINENNAVGAIIGELSSTDQDAGDTHSYTLVSGTGSTDNASFSIDGNYLKAKVAFDFETKSSYTVRVRTTDAGGLTFEKAITITVININDAPTDLALSAVSIYENNAVNAIIGNLSSTDQDAGDKHTYTLVSGDVAAFKVSGSQLLANAAYVYGTKNIYDIVVKTTDAGGLSVNKAIRITILQSPVLMGSANLARNNQSSAVGQNVTISKGYSANLNLSGSGIVKYAWSPATGLSSTNISNPIARPTQTTTYTVRVTNAQGISTDVFITVTVLEDYNITPNNVLSPDGDGVNDFWTIENLSTYPNNEVKIFDKAGRIIFNVKNYQNSWNGQLNGATLHEGAYYYIINLGPGTRPKVGYITLFSNK
jgi:gliding motility-associated-like protein